MGRTCSTSCGALYSLSKRCHLCRRSPSEYTWWVRALFAILAISRSGVLDLKPRSQRVESAGGLSNQSVVHKIARSITFSD